MTVQKRKTRDAQDEPLFDIPPALLAELEAMNKNIDQHQYVEPQEQAWSEDDEMPEETEAQVEMPETPDEDPLAEYRLEILGKAAHIVTRDRNIEYGAPEDTFAFIASLWNAYLGEDNLLTTDVAAMLALLKIARLRANPGHEDSYVDLAGYAACGASCAKALVEQQGERDERDL